jgi:hypothetical protein
MNTTDDTRRTDQIEDDIARTRAEVSSTIDAIQERLTPGQMMDQAIHYLRDSGAGDFGANLGRQVRDNPLPVALIGMGVAWLAMGGGARTDVSPWHDAATPRSGRTSSRYAADGADAPPWTAYRGDGSDDGARGGLDEPGLGDRVAQAGSSAGERVRARAGSLRRTTRMRVDRVRARSMRMIDEQPLVLGAIGVAIGAAIGAALPATRREDELLGDARDGLLEGAHDIGGEAGTTGLPGAGPDGGANASR